MNSVVVKGLDSFYHGATALVGQGLLIFENSRSHSVKHAPLGRTCEWPARRRDLHLTTHNTHKRQTSILPAGFEPTIPTGQRPQTHALDRVTTGIGERFRLQI